MNTCQNAIFLSQDLRLLMKQGAACLAPINISAGRRKHKPTKKHIKDRLLFVSSDQELLAAADKEGLLIRDPEAEN